MAVTMTDKIDTAAQLRIGVELRARIRGLRRSGVPLKDLGQAVGLSECQVSRIATQPESALPAATAMELVRMGERGELDHESFIEWLKVWPYEPQDKPSILVDDTVLRDNSWDAVEHAYDNRILSDAELPHLLEIVNRRGLVVV